MPVYLMQPNEFDFICSDFARLFRRHLVAIAAQKDIQTLTLTLGGRTEDTIKIKRFDEFDRNSVEPTERIKPNRIKRWQLKNAFYSFRNAGYYDFDTVYGVWWNIIASIESKVSNVICVAMSLWLGLGLGLWLYQRNKTTLSKSRKKRAR